MVEVARFVADVIGSILAILIANSLGRYILALVVLNLIISFLFTWFPKYYINDPRSNKNRQKNLYKSGKVSDSKSGSKGV